MNERNAHSKIEKSQLVGKERERALSMSVPNLLTYGRILAVPALFATFFMEGPMGSWIAFALFVAASVTDFFDGYLARAWSQQSALGRMLDPIADKLLIAGCLLGLCAIDTINSWSLWAAVIILFREVAVSGLREFLAELNVSVPVTYIAKWKTTLQMVALGVLLAAPAAESFLPGTTTAGIILLWVAAIITLYTGYDYFRSGMRHLLGE